MKISQRIKELRKSVNLSQGALAKKIGASYASTVSNWENEIGEPNSILRKKLCKIFGITEAEFFTFSASAIKEPKAKYLCSGVTEALKDPLAVNALLATYKSSKETKKIIKAILESIPTLPTTKRKALLALCK